MPYYNTKKILMGFGMAVATLDYAIDISKHVQSSDMQVGLHVVTTIIL